MISHIRNAIFRQKVAVRYITRGRVSTILYSQITSDVAEDDPNLFSAKEAVATLLLQIEEDRSWMVAVRVEDLDELADRWERIGLQTWRAFE